MDQKKDAVTPETEAPAQEKVEVEELDDLDLAKVAGGGKAFEAADNTLCGNILC